MFHIFSEGNARAILAARTLDDFCITCATVSAPDGWASWIVALPIDSCPAPVWIMLSNLNRPDSIAAAAVNGFSVEPGSNRSVTARLRVRPGSNLPRLLGL